jgi:folate-dependent tRNA-U54 methylase TrmFO/GidA
MNANFGLMEELEFPPRDKMIKRERYAERALAVITAWRDTHALTAALA